MKNSIKFFVLITLLIFLNSCWKVDVLNLTTWNNSDYTGNNCTQNNEVNWKSCEWNYVWWAAMNFAWNELKDNILKENVILDTTDTWALDLAEKFNNSVVTKNILDEESYYVKSWYWQKTIDTINQEVSQKFPNKSFSKLDFTLKDTDIISYSYFFKKVEYKEPFKEQSVLFKNGSYKWFEVENDDQRKNVKILNYESDDKFIVKLDLKDNSDELILVKWYDMNSPDEAIKYVNKYDKENLNSLEYSEQYHDFFEAPNLTLDYHRDYDLLIDKHLKNKVLVDTCIKYNLPDNCYKISKMYENIKFDMDNKWAKVENEAVFWLIDWAMPIEEPKYIVRNFYLNNDYWIIMKRNNSEIPYFILWVKNWNLMTK